MFRRSPLIVLFAVACPLLLVAVLVFTSTNQNPEDSLLDAGYNAYFGGGFHDAEQIALEILIMNPDSADGLALAAQAAAAIGEFARVQDYATRLAQCEFDPNPEIQEQLASLAEALVERNRLALGEQVLRLLVKEAPLHKNGRKKLADILAMTGRRREAREHTIYALLHGPVTVDELVMAADDANIFEDKAGPLRTAAVREPDDPVACYGVAWMQYQSNNSIESEVLCREAIQHDPTFLDAHALLGQILADNGKQEDLQAWHKNLPKNAADHDEIWAVRGVWLRDQGDNEAAARCFWESILRNPEHRLANLELGKLLSNLDRTDAATAFLHRGDYLRRLYLEMNAFDSDELRKPSDGMVSLSRNTPRATTDAMKRIAEILAELNREDEALGWAAAAQEAAPELVWPPILMQRLMQGRRDYVASSANPALGIDLSNLKLPTAFEGAALAVDSSGPRTTKSVRFVNAATDVGLQFTYFNSPNPEPGKSWPFEWYGGGNGVLDYDLDGWPDIYLTQGCPLAPKVDDHQYQDVLYKNQGADRFDDVTSHAGLGDPNFSYGCAAGDFDNDGFPDLYVCNLGQNRLYRNNGDGTFADVTEEAGVEGNTQTTCAAIVDLNGDGLAEIYDVNHMTLESAFAEACIHGGVTVACEQGRKFDPEQDRLFENLGDGSFIDKTSDSGIVAPLGLGLGIVAADFSSRGQIDLFVANDGYANFYFINQTQQPGANISFRESAVTSGVAFDPNGDPQACMGIATADADGDGLLDLFITNYFEEENAFYRQTGAEFFVDNTRSAGLFMPSYALLGFGTQFIDGDLEGLRDLVITNGHVEDFSSLGQPYRQRPQYLANLGDSKFSELPAKDLGDFFAEEHLGRGLSRIDWNRDGREDCVVSHLDSPVALLTNNTPKVGNFISIRLRAVTSQRDAIGARVTVRSGNDSWMQGLTAGDGYMASNQRQLVFGLGTHQQVDSLTISWPSGHQDEFTDIASGSELVMIEGKTQAISLSQ